VQDCVGFADELHGCICVDVLVIKSVGPTVFIVSSYILCFGVGKKIRVKPKKREEKIRWNLGKDGRHRRKDAGSSVYLPTEFE